MGVTVGIDLGKATPVVAALVDGEVAVIPPPAHAPAGASALDPPMAEDALAALIEDLVSGAAAHLGAAVGSVSVVVPGSMGDDQRQVVERALRSQPGALRVYRTLEAAAGALARLGAGREVLIVDVNATTAEAAVVDVGRAVVECLSIGHRLVGGIDVDPEVLPPVERCRQLVRLTLDEAGRRTVDAVVVTGSASRTPALRRMLMAETGLTLAGGVSPDTFAAEGAARRNGVLEGTLAEPRVEDLRPAAPAAAAPATAAPPPGADGPEPAKGPTLFGWPEPAEGPTPLGGPEPVKEPTPLGGPDSMDEPAPLGGPARREEATPERTAVPSPAVLAAPGMAGPDWSRLGRKGGRRSLAWAAATIAAVGIFLSYLNTSADTAERERASELAAAPTATTSRYLTTSPYLTTGFNGGIGGVAIPTFSTTTLPAGVSSKLWYLLATGDCLRDLPGSTGIEEVIVVSCDTSHAAQVFATDHVGLSLPEILRPALEGESTSTTRSDPGDRCYDAFEAAVGVRPAQTHYEISYLLSSTPTLSGIPGVAPLDPLARNTVVCLLSPNDGSTLSQSALAG